MVWLTSVVLEAIGWLAFFKSWPTDGVERYARNILACACGICLAAGSFLGVVPPNSLMATSSVAAIAWTVVLTTVTRPWARRLPLTFHVVLSMLWVICGGGQYFGMCY